MINTIEILYEDRIKNRKKYKPQWASSVELSKKGIDTAKLRKLCKGSLKYYAIKFIIGGTVKYWFERRYLEDMIELSGARRYQL